MQIKLLIKKIDVIIFGPIVKLLYRDFYRPKYNYKLNIKILLQYGILQKLFRINGNIKWPVHFTSVVSAQKNIIKGVMCDPGDTPNCYIQAYNGIIFGNNIEMGPGVKIISQNHDLEDFSLGIKSNPIKIGNNVWIGANAVILPGIQIGDNVIIGAGSIVSKNIPSNSIAVGNPCKVIKDKAPYKKDYRKIILNRGKNESIYNW